MPRAKQLTVACENRPGTLAHVARVLGDGKVNILAFHLTTSGIQGSAQLVVDNPAKAKKALERAGFSYAEEDVLYVELPNVPGALGSLAGKLAARDININFGYQSSAKATRKASVVLGVSDLDKAARIR